MPPVPRGARAVVLVLSVLTLLTAAVGAGVAAAVPLIQPGQRPSLALLGGEVVVLVAAVFGVLWGRGRFADAPALGLACVSGTVLLASALGWQGAGRVVAGWSLTPLLGFRALVSVAIAAVGAWLVLSRDPRSWGHLARAAMCLGPLVIAGVLYALPRTRGPIVSAIGASTLASFAVVIFGSLLAAVLVSAGAHQVIRAFERGQTQDLSDEPGRGSGAGGAGSVAGAGGERNG